MRDFMNDVATTFGAILAFFGAFGLVCALSTPFSFLGGVFYLGVGLSVSLSSSVAMRSYILSILPKEVSLTLQEK
jgi:hypothetical protein